MTHSATTPFDRQARDYDAKFSERLPARWLREHVRRHVEPLARAGDAVVEVGCGTGLDAMWFAARGCRVAATDVSGVMLAVARARPMTEEIAARISWSSLDASQPGDLAGLLGAERRARLIFSNFGALNCVRELTPLFESLRPILDPEGRVAVVLMGKFCLWESARFAARGQWTQMRRRWSGASRYGDASGSIEISYHSPADVMRAAPGFERVGLYGIGALLPPSEAFAVSERWPWLFRQLAVADLRLGRWLHAVSDHYLLIMKLRR